MIKVCLAARHVKPLFTPLALLYLKAYLVEREGMPAGDITIREFAPEVAAEHIAAEILSCEPDVVGLSCYVWNVQALLAACAILRRERPALPIILGGPEVGPVGKSVLERHPAVSAVVKSEGEGPFAAIVRAHAARQPLAGIPGLWCRDGGEVVDTGEAPILMDLNTLPSPHREEYAGYDNRFICIETQRGCVFRCNFCFYNKDFSIRNRRFDLDRVKQEIRFWIERDVAEIYLMDPIFNLKAERAKEICRFIIEHNHRGVAFHAEVWAEFIDDELARLMRAANFQFTEVGLQTTEETALAAVERRLRMAPFLAGIGHLKRHGIPFEVQLIYGLPGETVASFKRSLDFAVRLDPPHLAVFPLMVLPGTELWHKADVLGLRYDPAPPYFIRSHPGMTEQEVSAGWRLVDAVDTLGPSRTIRLLCKEPGMTFSGIVDYWLEWSAREARPTEDGERVRLFVADFCRSHGLPAAFYGAFAGREFAA